jgi:mycobactin phenyloxazoline synthetase
LPRRWYRTRDIVRVDEVGQLFYVGRTDRMVKVRGMRVDLGEIESALGRVEGVRECAVVALPDPELGARLHAFVGGAADGLAEGPVRAALARLLPSHMVPEKVHLRAELLPHTATGKIDRVALTRSLQPPPA